ncbi:HRDC domain-containing protein [Hymenobacter humi]|uniref:HRDC domain-containing protein n=1 Tax=Hymenobacter humi TaxID=1411620 RepID=A0ABW2U358_9BACT
MPIFRELYMLRDTVARQLDRPPYHVLSNDRLAELARQPIETPLQLRTANGLHPELKRSPYAEQPAGHRHHRFGSRCAAAAGAAQVSVPPPAQRPCRRPC